MRRYANAVDLRRALEARLKQRADETGADLSRLRRVAVFDRIGARLSVAERRWVLKGGTSLEFRLGGRARATKDLDLALPDGPTYDGEALREELIETLALDVDGDGFAYSVKPPTSLEPDAAGRPGWRFSVDSRLAGKSFAAIRLDVVLRGDELAATEHIALPGVLDFADVPPRTIESVDRRQHFAEKLHALTRDYGSRPNTRVKDLVDMVLLIEDGLAADKLLLDVVNHVFAVRATHPVPTAIPDPPFGWAKDYPMLAEDLTLADPDLTTALDLLRKFWAQALTTETEPD
ncbi:nucleotidyl transferase AbiEii/AbiGii toxin family protein [Actinomadura decatromicini]|uniref:Nucleotidyl transferase AbiEii/AbiGii toxin family protein n=1 Tax=Actinomadura decatromicini TaxID=2604572 RepID=A0A5D3FLT2_9ACTN|nr:nucleotidyl transferase AbiEii/AbiGii toxin family protein [Actinomadura decatromicini]TYK49183.1 nucleotidyl transferase AbiEii/AbiGii toxin family protein [Actinomadura decatromicini]